MSDVIAAVSTPTGQGGVAIIRISGDGALSIAEKIFRPAGRVSVRDFEPYRMYPGRIDPDGCGDYGLCVFFRAPHSFTGEDTVELHCHGGTALTRAVLQAALDAGCRTADRGEYTKRAFLNGKLSLSGAEGLGDLIAAESDAEIRAAGMLYGERLTEEAKCAQDDLKELLAEIDADIDFPEEEIERSETAVWKKKTEDIRRGISALVSTYGTGRKISGGVRVVLAGRPNTGKSSLLNALLGERRAIVSAQAGTTRDSLDGTTEIGGVRFVLYDTAGVRDSADEIESEGVERTKKLIEGADLVLCVLDGSCPLTEEDRAFLSLTENRPRILVFNKADLPVRAEGVVPDITLSAKTGTGLEELRGRIFSAAMDGYNPDALFITKRRHYEALLETEKLLEEAERDFGLLPPDLCGVPLREAWDFLGRITGETAGEKIIDEIFEKFCLGK